MKSPAKIDVAVIVAVTSAAISLTSLTWQLALYRLSGARLLVRLLPAVITEAGHLVKGPATGWVKSKPMMRDIVGNRPWVDVAVLEFVNVGRAAISLLDMNLDIGASPRWKPWKRHTVGMPPIGVHNALSNLQDVRLEGGHSVSLIVDVWPVIEMARRERNPVYLRASVRPAGRRQRRSPWRHRWKIEADRECLWPHGPEDARVRLFQAVWREVAPLNPSAVYDAWVSVTALLLDETRDPKNLSIQDVLGALEHSLGDRARMILPSTRILAAIHEHGRAGAWL